MENYHLIKDGENWKLKKENASRASKVFEGNKQDAIQQSAQFLRGNEGGSLKIHKTNGRIQEERTYPRKNDPSESIG